jgi:hypothetical protein
LKFESLKNDFEKSFKKENLLFFFSPSPLSFLFQPAHLLFLARNEQGRRPSFPMHSGPGWPSLLPAGPALPPPFSFAGGHWQVGPGHQAHPLPPAAGWPRPLFKPPAVTGRVCRFPAIKPP